MKKTLAAPAPSDILSEIKPYKMALNKAAITGVYFASTLMVSRPETDRDWNIVIGFTLLTYTVLLPLILRSSHKNTPPTSFEKKEYLLFFTLSSMMSALTFASLITLSHLASKGTSSLVNAVLLALVTIPMIKIELSKFNSAPAAEAPPVNPKRNLASSPA
jgi:hypothetical protein